MIDKTNYLLKEKLSLKFFYIIIVLTVMISFFYNTQIIQASDGKISILYFNNRTEQSSWDWLSKDMTDVLLDDFSQVNSFAYSSGEKFYKFDS